MVNADTEGGCMANAIGEDLRLLECVGLDSDAASAPVVELDICLHKRGLGLMSPQLDIPTGSGERVVVVLLTPALLASDDAGTALRNMSGRSDVALLPISLFDGAAPALEELSNIPLKAFGVERAAERIAIVAEAGAEDLVAWNRLTERAGRWEHEARSQVGLLARTELEAATQLLLRPVARMGGETSQTVGDLVAASRRRLGRVSRVRWAIGGLVAVAMSATGIMAFGQYQQAQAATESARLATNAAEARRLVDEAVHQAEVDPDLPWLLLERALELDASPPVVASAARTAAGLVPHETHDLRAPALGLSTSSGSMVAVDYTMPHGFDVINAASGQVVLDSRSIGEALTFLALSPDGTRLAVSDEQERLHLISVEMGRAEPFIDVTNIQAVSWIDERRVFVADEQSMQIVDIPTGSRTTIPGDPDEIYAAATHARHGWIVIAAADGLRIHDVEDGRLMRQLPFEGLRDLALSRDGSHLVARSQFTLQRVPVDALLAADNGGVDPPLPEPINASARATAVSDEGDLVLGTAGGELAFAPHGGAVVTRRFPAHRAPVNGVALIDDVGWLSVAGDARLRIWSADKIDDTFAGGQAVSSFMLNQVPVSGFEASFRGTIVASADGSVATVAGPYLDEASIVDRRSLKTIASAPLGGLAAPTHPAQQQGVVARFDPYGVATVIDFERMQVASTDEAPLAALVAVTAVSPDGTKVALAGAGMSYVWDFALAAPAWETFEHEDLDSPMHLEVDDNGRVSVIGHTGEVVRNDGTTRVLREESQTFAAGAFVHDGTALLVDTSGRLHRAVDGSLEELARVSGDLDPLAIRVSPEETHAAVIGSTGTEVLALESGQVVLRLLGDGGRYFAVTDVMFDDDSRSLVALRFNGSLSRWSLLEEQHVIVLVDTHQPRSLTELERELFRFSQAAEESTSDE
jgi:DNA-binding beta-propeller fold protein YncE